MCFHCAGADHQSFSDLTVRYALRDKDGHLALTFRQTAKLGSSRAAGEQWLFLREGGQGCLQEVFTESHILNRCAQLFDDLPRSRPLPLGLFFQFELSVYLSKRALHAPYQRGISALMCAAFGVLKC